MSFIIKNVNESVEHPNLRIGEIYGSQIEAALFNYKNVWDSMGFGNSIHAEFNVNRSGDTVNYFTMDYSSKDYLDFLNADTSSNYYKGALYLAQQTTLMISELHELVMPNLGAIFPYFWISPFSETFESNIEMSATGNNPSGRNVKLTRTGSSINVGFPGISGGIFVNTKDEFLKFGGSFSIAFNYHDNIEETLNYVKANSTYYSVSILPKAFTDKSGKRVFGGLRLYVQFGENKTDIKGLFRDLDISKTVHSNDLPDDLNTYPGGGEDSNTYPEDTDEGLNSSGNGTFDNTNDPIDFPSLPLWDATSTGFISMYNPTITEIIALYGFLWDSDISTTLKKLFIEPLDAIISLAFFPVDPIVGTDKRNVTIGHVDSGITMNHVQKQFVTFDFGSIKLDEYYGAAWDYSPYTKVSIFLPYIGSQELDVDDVMNATLTLRYGIDLLSGMCTAMLKCTRTRDGLNSVMYTWQGNCAMQVPITAGSAREFLNSIIQLGAMTGLALVQPAAGSINAAIHGNDSEYKNSVLESNNWVNPTIAGFSALNVLGQKVHVQRGGRVDANAGVMSLQKAYIIINRPVSAIPRTWNQYAGYPSLKVKSLASQKGFTQVAFIKLTGLKATSEEIYELDSILKGGVIL